MGRATHCPLTPPERTPHPPMLSPLLGLASLLALGTIALTLVWLVLAALTKHLRHELRHRKRKH